MLLLTSTAQGSTQTLSNQPCSSQSSSTCPALPERFAAQQELHYEPCISVSCNYDIHPRLALNTTDTRLPFEVETNLQLIELSDGHNHRGWTPLFEGEQFIKRIAGGGSGASIALLKNTHGELIIRKLQPGADHCEAARAQNAESIGQAIFSGKEPMTSLKPQVQLILQNKSEQIERFVQLTRPEVTKRFVLLREREGQSNRYFGSGYDQAAFRHPKQSSSANNANTAPEFAKTIQNHNQPLSRDRMAQLCKAQTDQIELFQAAQADIHLAPLSHAQGKRIFYDTYIAKFEKRLGVGFSEAMLSEQCHQALYLQSEHESNASPKATLQLRKLLLAPSIIVNGKACLNPLAYAHQIKNTFASFKEGFVLHGDPQQTNAILIENETTSSLKCIDNRGADVQDYLSDLSKILWGPEFIPIMEDMLEITCIENDKTVLINTAPSKGQERAVDNLNAFSRQILEKSEQLESTQLYLEGNKYAKSQLHFTGALQYLRDLGFVLPRLKSAIETGDKQMALKISRRIIGDFAAAAVKMTEHALNRQF